MSKILKGDQVIVNTGKDKGKRGIVSRVLENGLVIVEGINLAKKHEKPNPMKGVAGGIVAKEMPIQASNIALFNAATEKADRVGYKVLKDGRKIRVYKSNGEAVQA
ncbi:MAG: 50S ribosomal protein L24 [Methylophilaceae bacterium]|jgi:large subunit ribosomal protein L24|nr:50S ribosomal protein L24 [Methylophilaceae bacterium]MDG1454285.1 50S ribosomal protein L24 [Methylophilaceae bacterium]